MTDLHGDASRLRAAFAGRRVLLTGHTGFKGGWMTLMLRHLGATVVGVALPQPPGHSFFAAARLLELVDSRYADIRNAEAYRVATADVDADLVIHMAAQPFVLQGYRDPVETFAANVAGTVCVLQAARRMPSLKAVIVVTSDKCYQNDGRAEGYRETDPLGGADPYSASKACAELAVASMRRSFFSEPGAARLATVRAGNVYGGGDWGADRLIPDLMRAVEAGGPLRLRNPAAVRPWQHVLDPLSGYLHLAAALMEGDGRHADAWNFGPEAGATPPVREFLAAFLRALGDQAPEILVESDGGPAEARVLRVDSARARRELGWRPRISIEEGAAMTVAWHAAHWSGDRSAPRTVAMEQIETFFGRTALALHTACSQGS